MPHPLPPFPRLASPRAMAITRARVSAATASAGALMAGATLLLTPRAAHANDGLYEMCLDAVHGLASRCVRNSDTFVGDLACMWMGGVGYLACAALEAIRQLIPGGLNIT